MYPNIEKTMSFLRVSAILMAMAAGSTHLVAQGAGTEYDGVTIKSGPEAALVPLPAILIIRDQDAPVGQVDRRLLGIAHDWSEMNNLLYERNLRAPFISTFRQLPIPLNRIGGAEGQAFRWKLATGPIADREPQKLWSWQKQPVVMRCGPVEWVQTLLAAAPETQFVVALNLLTDSPEDHADLAELLLAQEGENPNGGTDWARYRIKAGLAEPARIFAWELGNENDWRGGKQAITPHEYIVRCQASIAAIRSVDPQARFTTHAGAAPHNTTHPRPYEGGWQTWHKEILAALGNDIDYLVFHPYYNRIGVAEQERFIAEIRRDITKITGSDRIKLFFSEHATWPPEIGKRENWFHTHSLHGSLLTAQFLIDQLHFPGTVAACWSMSAGPWGFFYPTSSSTSAQPELYTTGLLDTFQLLNRSLGDQVLASTIEGERTRPAEHGTTFASAVMRDTADGEIRIILANLEPTASRELSLRFQVPHRLVDASTLTADSLVSHNTEKTRTFRTTTENAANTRPLVQCIVPPRSLVLLRLQPVP